ncbi:MAG TPA: hypothetical protein VGC41_05295 [Kofleriaceae bacterium]
MKKMFKVLTHIDRNGTKFWMDLGRGFPNRDESINMYLNAIPTPNKDGEIKLQLREMTEEDFQRSAERRAQREQRTDQRSAQADAGLAMNLPVQMEAANTNDVPF